METEQTQAQSTNPFTGEVVLRQKFMTEDEINKRIQDSWNAFMNFRRTDINTRSTRLNSLASTFEKNMDRLAKTITSETGKPLTQSREEVTRSVELIRYYVQNAQEIMRPEELKVKGAKRSYVIYEPLGPIFNISSYNYPLLQDVKRGVPAILMGNTVLSRSSSWTPQTGLLIEELYRDAGFTNGEFLSLITSQDQSELIIRNPLIRAVSYVGGVSGGQFIGSLAGKYSKKYVSEQGSNDVMIVMKDANLEWAVTRAISSRTAASGQSGMAPKTFVIEDGVYDRFRDMLIERLKSVTFGDPMDEKTTLGPLSNKPDLQKTMDQLKRSQDQGAKVLYGGNQPQGSNIKGGLFFTPTVLEVQPGNVLLNEETFAPIFPLLRFRTEEEICRFVNSSMFGCGCAIFTKDESRAEKLIPMLEVGTVFINNTVSFHPELPMGGIKWSGVGRSGGRWGAWELSNIKSVFISSEMPTTMTK